MMVSELFLFSAKEEIWSLGRLFMGYAAAIESL